MNLLDVVSQKYSRPEAKNLPDFKPGDTLRVHVLVKEGVKTRTQLYEGVCIARKSAGKLDGHFRVRKISSGYGVERVFPYHSPSLEKIEVINRGKVGRAKLFFLRDRTGKSAKIETDYSRS